MLIKIEVPEELGHKLRPYQDRLPELLELGLREVQPIPGDTLQDVETILNLLTSRPTPEEILTIRPSDELQTRFSDLIAQRKTGDIPRDEELELERYLMLEHIVRLAKAQALHSLGKVQDETNSPLDAKGVDLGLTTEEILQFIQEGRRM